MTTVLERARAQSTDPPPSGRRTTRPADRLRQRWPLLLTTVLAAVAEGLPAAPGTMVAAAGLWLLFAAPITLWYAAADAVVSTRLGRIVLATGCTVVTDILLALLVNTALPAVGVAAPLQRPPLAVASVLFIGVFAAIARPGEPVVAAITRLRATPAPGLTAVLGLGVLATLLAVAGPIRLNNGFGATVAVLALLAVAALIIVLLAGRRRHSPAVTGTGLFFVALALLLLTSLRGWYITGHDIQREWGVFQQTYQAGRWSIAAFRDPYNACLSITLLPASITRLTGIPAVYVLKVIFPVLFAVTPVAVYRAVRHGAPQIVAILSAVYFVAFPTFFTDMPFLVRQEVAFLLLGCAVLVLMDTGRPRRIRRAVVTALLAGIVLSHYSTTYVVLAVLALACAVGWGWRLMRRRRGDTAGRFARPAFVTWWMIALTALAAVLWTGPVTQTGGQARRTAEATVLELLGRTTASGSSDTAYSLFGGERVSAQQRLDEYAAETARDTAPGRAAGAYLPLDVIERFPAPAVEPAEMPLTPMGEVLRKAGVDVAGVNSFLRQSAARLLQVLLLIGLIMALAARRRRIFVATPDQLLLSVGAIGVVVVFTVLPELSVDYGVLRAFQQGLFFFAPFIAAASIWIFRWAGRRATALACVLAVALFLDLAGVVPKMLGGYPAQLHLANAGQYYDIYYLHPEERAGIAWVQSRASETERDDVQSEIQTDRYTFGRMQTLVRGRASNDIYPTLVGVNAFVFLGYTTVHRHETTVFYRGDLVTYRYPVALLDRTKNKIYSSEGTEVYR